MTSRIVAIMCPPSLEQLARAREYTAVARSFSSLVEGSEQSVAWIELFAGVPEEHGDQVRDWVLTGEGPMPQIVLRMTNKLAQWQAVREYCESMGYR